MRRSKKKSLDQSIPVSRFKAHCHAIVDTVAKGKVRRVVLTKRGKPVAALIPYFQVSSLRGAMKGTVFIPPGVDITEPTGEIWDAEQ